MIQNKIYDTPWFFALMMIILFIVSYCFWGVLFLGPNKSSGRPERGLHNSVNTNNQKGSSQRGIFPGMGGGRTNAGLQGGENNIPHQGGNTRQGSMR